MTIHLDANSYNGDVDEEEETSATPETVIVIGSGCSAGLGVPTMVNFMDTVFEQLGQARDAGGYKCFDPKNTLRAIQEFISKVKGSAAYVRTDLLNIEELYGLADMELSLGLERKNTDQKLKNLTAFNRAIFMVAQKAGIEFITDDTYKNIVSELSTIKRESHTDEPSLINTVSHYTNLIAYLSMASYRDASTYPLYVQFNWDLGLDRAFYRLQAARKPEFDAMQCCTTTAAENGGSETIGIYNMKNKIADGGSNEETIRSAISQSLPWIDYRKALHVNERFDFSKSPLMIRPHGGINWVKQEGGQSGHYDNVENLHRALSVASERDEYGNICYNNRRGAAIDHTLIYDEAYIEKVCGRHTSQGDFNVADHMNISPPTWEKNVEQFLDQWSLLRKFLKKARRILFVGYSMPKSDLYFRHFLALSLAENNYAPKVYVLNPGISKLGPVRDSYTDLFAPLAREGRLYGIDGYFGDPALYDLNRIFHHAKRIDV